MMDKKIRRSKEDNLKDMASFLVNILEYLDLQTMTNEQNYFKTS